MKLNVLILILLISGKTRSQDLSAVLASSPFMEEAIKEGFIRPISYDLQLQLPLSEVNDPDTPLFTARVVIQFELTKEINTISLLSRDPVVPAASIRLSILGLDHFENVSIVYNGAELDIANVILTDTDMQIVLNQPVLFTGRYTLSVQRYKGFIGNALYYRDAGNHAVFGSNFFPHRVSAVMPVTDPVTNKVSISLTIVHQHNTIALSSAPEEGSAVVLDEHWMVTSFRPTEAISPGLLAIAVLPDEYQQINNTLTGVRVTLHYNKYRMTEQHAQKVLDLATQVVGLLRSFFASAVAMPKIDIVIINDISQTNGYGTVILSEDRLIGADIPNQIHVLAGQLTRQWIGGLFNVNTEADICLQEDLAEYMAFKLVKRMHNDETIRLSHYAKVMLNEELFEPGHTLEAHGDLDRKIATQCGLKGVIFLESIEAILGEKEMLQRINKMLFTANDSHISVASFMQIISEKVDDGIDLAQVYNFWWNSRGVPNLYVERIKDALQLSQIVENRTIKYDFSNRVTENMTLWPLNLEFSDFKLPLNLMVSQGVHLAPVRESLSMANLGFKHFYRVNYDIDTWRYIKDALFHNTTLYSVRERAQLVSDFCHFYQRGEIQQPLGEKLRNEFIQMVRLRSDHFLLCELFTSGCGAGPITKEVPRNVLIKLRKQLDDALRNDSDFNCGRGAAHIVADLLCRETTGNSCL